MIWATRSLVWTVGTHCMCLKSDRETTYIKVSQTEINEKLNSFSDNDDDDDTDDSIIDDDDSDDSIYYLYATDFEDGTFIITQSGTYVLMEDIEFDFKSKTQVLFLYSIHTVHMVRESPLSDFFWLENEGLCTI